MKSGPVSNLRWALLLLASLLILAALVFVDQRLLPRRVNPTGTPVVAISTSIPANQVVYLHSTKLGAHRAVTLNFPAAWQVIDLDAVHLEQVLGKLQVASAAPPVREAVNTLLSALEPDSTALFALLLDEQATRQATLPPTFTLVVLPRHGLSLSNYLVDVGDALRRQSGLALLESQLDYTLRADNLPVAILHYTLPAVLAPDALTALDGYQIAAFDAQAANLIVFTFTTPSPRYTELLPMFRGIVHNAQFPE